MDLVCLVFKVGRASLHSPRLRRLYCIHPALCFICVSSERHLTFLFREVLELGASSKQVAS